MTKPGGVRISLGERFVAIDVLIVEDDPRVARVITRMLARVLEVAAQQRGLVRALVTASNNRKVLNRAVTGGAYVVGKPFDKEQLAPLIEGARALADPFGTIVTRQTGEWALTPRQVEVVRMLVAGTSRDEIPLAIGISKDTFRAHVRELLSRSQEGKVDGVIIALLRGAIADLVAR